MDHLMIFRLFVKYYFTISICIFLDGMVLAKLTLNILLLFSANKLPVLVGREMYTADGVGIPGLRVRRSNFPWGNSTRGPKVWPLSEASCTGCKRFESDEGSRQKVYKLNRNSRNIQRLDGCGQVTAADFLFRRYSTTDHFCNQRQKL
jgi:hypothetical protein